MVSDDAGRAPSERSVLIGRCAAAAALLGGAAWTAKAGMILATGDEPSAAFAIGFVLFPFALLGLWSTVREMDGRATWIGGLLAAGAALCAVLMVVVRAAGGEGVEPSEDEVTLLTPFITLAALGTVAALIALGITARRTSALPSGYVSLPLTIGLATIPLLIAGAALEGIHDRLFELPIALLGLGWIGLGIALWNAPKQHPPGGHAKP